MSETQKPQAQSAAGSNGGDSKATPPQGSNPKGATAKRSTLPALFVRDAVFVAGVVLLFIGSVIPVVSYGQNLWNTWPLFFLGVGIILPLILLILVVGSRLSNTHVRAGSFSLQQLGSIVASLSFSFYFLNCVTSFAWPYLIGLIGAAALLVVTVVAKYIPVLQKVIYDPRAEAKPKTPRSKATNSNMAGSNMANSNMAGSKVASPNKTENADNAGHSSSATAADSVAKTPGSQGVTSGVLGPVFGAGAATVQAEGARPNTLSKDLSEGSNEGSPITGPAPETQQSARVVPTESTFPNDNASRTEDSSNAVEDGAVSEPAGREPVVSPEAEAPHDSHQSVAPEPAVTQPSQAVAAPAPEDEKRPTASSAVPNSTMALSAADLEQQRKQSQRFAATVDPGARPAEDTAGQIVYEAFWFAVDSPRQARDERNGTVAFIIEPGSWYLALQDRGRDFLVQDQHGKVGVLHDLRNIERAPQEG